MKLEIDKDLKGNLDKKASEITKKFCIEFKNEIEKETKESVVISNNKVYVPGHLKYVDTGTRPHTVQGNPVLHWESGGVDYFARYVRHPGTRAKNIFKKAIDVALNRIRMFFK